MATSPEKVRNMRQMNTKEDTEEIRLGVLINQIAKMRGLPQKALIEAAGVTRSTINNFLSGRSDLNAESFSRVLSFLGIDVRNFLLRSLKQDIKKNLFAESISDDVELLLNKMSPVQRFTALSSFVTLAGQLEHRDAQSAVMRLKRVLDEPLEGGLNGNFDSDWLGS